MLQDVGCHKGWISKQSGIYVVGLLTSLVLERSYTLKFAEVCVHIEEQVKLENFLYVALQIYRRLFRVESACKVFSHDGSRAALNILRFRACSKRMPIGNKEETVKLILHFHKASHRTIVVSKMQISCWAYSTNNCFHVCI